MHKSLGLFVASILVFAGGLAVASHVDTPPISDGGELAYVRDYGNDTLDRAAAGETVTATYVSWELDHDTERLENWTSRGRMSDNVVFDEVRFPRPSVSGGPAEFWAVGQHERGMVTTDQACGCIGLMNSVNSGFAFVAKQNVRLEIVVSDDYEVDNVSDSRVELHRDGHVYAVETNDGTLETEGNNITVRLKAGGDVRSWVDGGAFPATTSVMHAEFDHLADSCLDREPAEPEQEEEPEEQPDNETKEQPDNETKEPSDNETAEQPDNETKQPEQQPAAAPHSKGFWANHPEEWPVTELTLGAQTYNQSELLDLLPAGTGDASVNLASQLIAAKLNVANGADDSEIADTIAEADDELAAFEGKLGYDVDPASETGQRMLELKDTLDAYNNGEL